MSLGEIAIVMLGALAGGFVSGLAGFGTGLMALGIWLYALEPSVAATLVIVCSVIAQAQMLPAFWREIKPEQVLPFIVPGLVGVPVGTALLAYLDARTLKVGVGVLLIAFSTTMLVLRSPRPLAFGGRIADALVGLAGGVLGGLAGLSGTLPPLWATLRGWNKATSRSIFQAFNLTILSAALCAHALSGFITAKLLFAVLAALPGTVVGAWGGAWAYTRLSDRRYRELILVLLAISGVTLIWASV